MKRSLVCIIFIMLFCTANARAAQHVLKTVLEGGSPNAAAASRIQFILHGTPEPISVGGDIEIGTTITTPAGITAVIARRDDKSIITVTPESSLTLIAAGDRVEADKVNSGKSIFDIVPKAFSFYRVGFRTFAAFVHGTVFSVSADGSRSVSFVCTRGAVDVVRPASAYIENQYRTVRGISLVEQISAQGKNAVTYSLDEEQYVKRFGSLRDAERYFQDQLAAAESTGDPVRIDAALSALFELYRTLGDARAHSIALQRLRFAQQHKQQIGERSVAGAYTQLAYKDDTMRGLANSERSLNLWKSVDPAHDEVGYALAQMTYADRLMGIGRDHEAFAALSVAYVIAQRAGSPVYEAEATEDTGVLDGWLHDYAGEARQYKAALEIMKREYKNRLWPDNLYFYTNLAYANQRAGNVQEQTYYASLALTSWHQLIADDTNPIISDKVDDYVSALQAWGRLDDALSAVNTQLHILQHSNKLNSEWGAALLEDRASVDDSLLKTKNAKADRTRAAAIRNRLPKKPPPQDRDLRLQQDESQAAKAGRTLRAVHLAHARVVYLRSRSFESPINVADAEIDLAYRLEQYGSISEAVSWRNRAIQDLQRLGEIGRLRVADEYADLARTEYAHHLDARAENDANAAISIATATPVLASQAASAYRALAWAYDDAHMDAERMSAFQKAVEYDKQAIPFNVMLFASDSDDLAWSLESVGTPQERIAVANAARNALLAADVPTQADVWDDTDSRLSEAYHNAGDNDKGLEYGIAAYNALAARRPLMNDESLVIYASDISQALEEMAHHDTTGNRDNDLRRARLYALKAVHILDNPQTVVLLPLRTVYAYETLEEIEMMLGSDDFISHVHEALVELNKQEKKGLNRPSIDVQDVIEAYLYLTEDAEIYFHAYDPTGYDRAAGSLILRDGEHLLDVTHALSEQDARYRYWLSVVDFQSKESAAAAAEISRAHGVMAQLSDEQRKNLIRSLSQTSLRGTHGTWDDYPLEAYFAEACADAYKQLSPTLQADVDVKSNMVHMYSEVAKSAIYERLPLNAVSDAKAGLEIDPQSQRLQLLLADGYLYSGDLLSAKVIYLAHRDEKFEGGTFADAALKDLSDYESAGIIADGADEITAVLSTPEAQR